MKLEAPGLLTVLPAIILLLASGCSYRSRIYGKVTSGPEPSWKVAEGIPADLPVRGQPIRSAVIRAVREGASSPPNPLDIVGEAGTDDRGEFDMSANSGYRYALSVQASGFESLLIPASTAHRLGRDLVLEIVLKPTP